MGEIAALPYARAGYLPCFGSKDYQLETRILSIWRSLGRQVLALPSSDDTFVPAAKL